MSITAADIKLLASERMADTSDGGGRRTGNVIPDGAPGNIFPKVSRLDSVYGRVNLRKVYGAVQTDSLETYAGAHAVIMDAPDNDHIHVSLFSTGSDFDDRSAARDRIESYVIAGPESRMTLYGRQLVGQGAITAYQGADEPLPEVGEVFCLSKETGGVVAYQQFVRVMEVSAELRTLEDNKSEFVRRVVTMKLATPLRHEFAGPDSPSRLTEVARPAMVRRTTVADAARYFGIQPVTEGALEGALTVKVGSIFTPIVPTTQRETPLSTAEISGATQLVPGSRNPAIETSYHQFDASDGAFVPFNLPTSVTPGTAYITLTAVGVPSLWVYVDDGSGLLVNIGDSPRASLAINYETGEITGWTRYSNYPTWRITIKYVPAAAVTQVAHTFNIPVTLETRGTVYVQTLRPFPAPGTLVIDFRALGKWYRLRDDGAGALAGDDPAYGVGTVDYATGAVIVTLGALPDVGSAVLMSWGSRIHTTPREEIIFEPPVWKHTLPTGGIEPTSVTISWELTLRDSAGTVTGTLAQSLTDDGDGNLVGDGIGRIVYGTGKLWFTPSKLPDPGTTPVVDYQKRAVVTESFTPTLDGSGMLTMTTEDPPVPGSVTLLWQTTRTKTTSEKSSGKQNASSYVVIPDPDPPAVSVTPGDTTDLDLPEGATPVSPYPLIGAAADNKLGLPVKFRRSDYTVGNSRVDVENGYFVIDIRSGATKYGGVPINPADVVTGGWVPELPPSAYSRPPAGLSSGG